MGGAPFLPVFPGSGVPVRMPRLRQENSRAMTNPIRKKLCWGDSVTEGMRMPPGKDYSARLAALLGDGYRVFNSGDGGKSG